MSCHMKRKKGSYFNSWSSSMFLVFAFGGDGVIAVNTDFADSNADGENVLLEFTLVGTNVVL
jgi:hypothetical protein